MNKQTRSHATLALLALLAVALIAQSIYLFRLNQKIDELESTPVADSGISPVSVPSSLTTLPALPGFGAGIDPLTSIRQLQQQMDAMFDPAWARRAPFSSNLSLMNAAPEIEVTETNDGYQIMIGVPENGDLELSTEVEDNTVRLAGSVNITGAENSRSLTSSFTSRSQFSRSIPLPKPVDPLALQTDRDDGAIVITIPKV